jgi:hypothetical protein
MHYRRLTSAFVIIFFLVISFTIFGSVTGQGQDEDRCEACHGTDGDYTFEHLSISLFTPRVVNPDETFEHVVLIDHPGWYLARDLTVELDLSAAENIIFTGSKSVQLDDMGEGKKTVTFKLQTTDPHQAQRIRTIVTYIAFFHYEPTQYTEIRDISITIDRILLTPSKWSIDLDIGDEKDITFDAIDNVQNLILIPSSNLEEIADLKSNLPQVMKKGDSFDVSIKSKKTGSGKLNLIYEDEGGIPHKTTVDIIITEEAGKGSGYWVTLGMVAGILSWIFLFMATIIGVPYRKLKPFFNKVFGSVIVRNKVHCWICYILIVLALFHAVMVMANHWNSVMLGPSFILAKPGKEYGWYINLGFISWILMILVSLTGLFWEQLIKLIKYNAWRWTHNIITVSALVIAITHGIIFLHARFL